MQYKPDSEDSKTINKPVKFDMATALTILEPFKGSNREDVHKWIKTTLMKTDLFGLDHEEKKILFILLLQDAAEDWATDNREEINRASLDELLRKLALRFTTQVSTEKILEKFLTRSETSTVEEYEEMLQEASVLFVRESINISSLLKMVIKKAPTKIQPILYSLAQTTATWQDFKARASEVTWLGFESEGLLNVVKSKSYQRIEGSNSKNFFL